MDWYGSIEDLESVEMERSVDEVLRVLSDEHARTTVAYLYVRPDTTLDQLAGIVAAEEAVAGETIATKSAYERARASLYHVTLPRLDAYGLIEFDADAKTVAEAGIPEPVYAFLGVDLDR